MFSFSAGARAKRVFSKVSTLGVEAVWDDCIAFPKIRGQYSNQIFEVTKSARAFAVKTILIYLKVSKESLCI